MIEWTRVLGAIEHLYKEEEEEGEEEEEEEDRFSFSLV